MAGIEDLDRLNRMVSNLYTAAFERKAPGQNAVFRTSLSARTSVTVTEGDLTNAFGSPAQGRVYVPLTTTSYSYAAGYSGTGRSTITSEFFKGAGNLNGAWVIAVIEPYWTDSSPPPSQTHATLFSYAGAYCGYNFSTKSWEVNIYGQTTGPSIQKLYPTSGLVTTVGGEFYYSSAGNTTLLRLWLDGQQAHVQLSGNLLSTSTTFTIGNEPSSGYNRPLKAGIRIFAGGPPPAPSIAPDPGSPARYIYARAIKERYVFDYTNQPNYDQTALYNPCTFLWQGGWSGTIFPGFYAPVSITAWQGDRYGECIVA